jgi:cytochrome o ubiquinol oxidase subunit 1
VRFTAPVLWTIGFMITFTIGGMTGVLLAVPAADFVLHNSLFLIAHFHNVIIGGVVFGCLAAIHFWFPKAFGFTLNEFWGKVSFWCWLVGFYVAFMPLYVLGFMGMTRRMNHYANPDWHPYLVVAAFGAVIIAFGIGALLVQFWVSFRERKQNLDLSGDPWDGRTLEWATSSPPPFYNFAIVPHIDDIDQHWEDKERRVAYKRPARYEDIHMPRNTGAGVYISVAGFFLCFGLIWHIWWLAGLGLLGMVGSFIARSYDRDVDYWVPASEVARIENERFAALKEAA